jgi:hypothetical protein
MNDNLIHNLQVIDRANTVNAMMDRKYLYDKYNNGLSNGNSVRNIKKVHELIADTDVSAKDKDLLNRLQLAMEKAVIENNIDSPTCNDLSSTGFVSVDECNLAKNTSRNYESFNLDLAGESASVMASLNHRVLISHDLKTGSYEVITSSKFNSNEETIKRSKKRVEILTKYAEDNINDSVKVSEAIKMIGETVNQGSTSASIQALNRIKEKMELNNITPDNKVSDSINVAIASIEPELSRSGYTDLTTSDTDDSEDIVNKFIKIKSWK